MSKPDRPTTAITVYRGNPNYVHIEDGSRRMVGRLLAGQLDAMMRNANRWDLSRKLCPGCYMVALFNAAIELAQANGQSLSELGNSMGDAFRQLTTNDPVWSLSREDIEVKLDPPEKC